VDTDVVIGAVGSEAELACVAPTLLSDHDDVVIVPTAAAFVGATDAAVRLARLLEPVGCKVEALMATDRRGAHEEHFASRVREARWVLLADGSALHARSVLRESPLGEALLEARGLLAIGAAATVIGLHMIDPRGGAPTIGLGLARDLAITPPESDDQMARTQRLLAADVTLVELGARCAVLRRAGAWTDVGTEPTRAWRAGEPVRLG
jgi:cyanophycinase